MKEKNEYDEKESLPKKNYCGKVMEGIKVIKRFLAINFSRRFIGNRGGGGRQFIRIGKALGLSAKSRALTKYVLPKFNNTICNGNDRN